MSDYTRLLERADTAMHDVAQLHLTEFEAGSKDAPVVARRDD